MRTARLPDQKKKPLAQTSLWRRLSGLLALLAFALSLALAAPAAMAGAPGGNCGLCLTQSAPTERLLLPLSEQESDPAAPQGPSELTGGTFADADEAHAFEAALANAATLGRMGQEASCLRPEASPISSTGGYDPPLRPPPAG
ncbi:hypothetical protein [Methylocella silvestris]|uniref:hypothetical protein n=1 Tax=Methylocella silvestris TaxID=199596 RepID=UPI0011AFBB15|nr:hypothetical protein [Methylocella silvestris]